MAVLGCCTAGGEADNGWLPVRAGCCVAADPEAGAGWRSYSLLVPILCWPHIECRRQPDPGIGKAPVVRQAAVQLD